MNRKENVPSPMNDPDHPASRTPDRPQADKPADVKGLAPAEWQKKKARAKDSIKK